MRKDNFSYDITGARSSQSPDPAQSTDKKTLSPPPQIGIGIGIRDRVKNCRIEYSIPMPARWQVLTPVIPRRDRLVVRAMLT